MRNAFIQTLCEEAEKNSSLWLLCGDLGYGVLEDFSKKFPNRYVNVGVAEQNMMGVAAGLAVSGKKVVTYSIVNFATFRCLEQIRNDICSHQADVKVVSVGAGFAYGHLSYTHYGVEDVAIMSSLPNMTIFSPGDRHEAMWATRMMLQHQGPSYLRLEKANEPVVHSSALKLEIGQAIEICAGSDVTLCSTGAILKNVVDAAEILKKNGVNARVLSFPTIKPLDHSALLKAYQETELVVTIEEHSAVGGFGVAVLDALQAEGCDTRRSLRIAVPNEVPRKIGSQNFLREFYGLSPNKIAEQVLAKRKDQKQ